MTIIIYLRDLLVSLLSNVGLPYATTVGLADISLAAIALGLIIAVPGFVLVAAVLVLLLAYLAGK